MKTEPTEALRAMANDLKYNVGVIHSNHQLILEESFISGVKYGQSTPKIKQLDWEELSREVIEADYEYPPESVFKAATPFMYYTIHKSFPNTFEVNGDPEIYSSIKEAKAAAQADFERRVMECLDIADNSNK